MNENNERTHWQQWYHRTLHRMAVQYEIERNVQVVGRRRKFLYMSNIYESMKNKKCSKKLCWETFDARNQLTYCQYPQFRLITGLSYLSKKCPNTEFILVHIFPHSDQKKLRIWTLFKQCLLSNPSLIISIAVNY